MIFVVAVLAIMVTYAVIASVENALKWRRQNFLGVRPCADADCAAWADTRCAGGQCTRHCAALCCGRCDGAK